MRDDINGKIDWVIIMLIIGFLFLVLETIKQILLIIHGYNIWYFPFQLCSMPIYLCLLDGALKKRHKHEPSQKIIQTFLMDYGLLGGIAALSYPAGFTNTGITYIAFHGYLWHVLMMIMAIVIYLKKEADLSLKGFKQATLLFLVLAIIAEALNILLHPLGDCDMFYISPYHYSTQPFFSSVELMTGRLFGIIFYLFMIVVGAAIIHYLFYIIPFVHSLKDE